MDEVRSSPFYYRRRVDHDREVGILLEYVPAFQVFLGELARIFARDPSSFPDTRVLSHKTPDAEHLQLLKLDLSVMESACRDAGRRFEHYDTFIHKEVSDAINIIIARVMLTDRK